MEMLGDGLHSFPVPKERFDKRVAQNTLSMTWTFSDILAVRYRSQLEGIFPSLFRSYAPYLALALHLSSVLVSLILESDLLIGIKLFCYQI